MSSTQTLSEHFAAIEPEMPYVSLWPYRDAWHVPASHRDVYGKPVEPQAALIDALASFLREA